MISSGASAARRAGRGSDRLRCGCAAFVRLLVAALAVCGCNVPPPAARSAPAAAWSAPAAAAVQGDGESPLRERQPALAAGAATAPCEAASAALARTEREVFRLPTPAAFAPWWAAPESTRAALLGLARELEQRPDVLLVRIEVWPLSARGGRAEQEAAQLRADSIADFLRLRGGVSADRLEPVGFALPPTTVRRDGLDDGAPFAARLFVMVRERVGEPRAP